MNAGVTGSCREFCGEGKPDYDRQAFVCKHSDKIPGDPRGKVPEFLNYQDFVVISFPNSHDMFILVFCICKNSLMIFLKWSPA